jgi:hypothetical protein
MGLAILVPPNGYFAVKTLPSLRCLIFSFLWRHQRNGVIPFGAATGITGSMPCFLRQHRFGARSSAPPQAFSGPPYSLTMCQMFLKLSPVASPGFLSLTKV